MTSADSHAISPPVSRPQGRWRTLLGRLNGEGSVEPLGVLLLPCVLEEYEFSAHAQDLMAIPRVIAIEPGRLQAPAFLGDHVAAKQARRLRFPGRPALFVLYGPLQYPLASALAGRYGDAELWYVRAEPPVLDREGRHLRDLLSLDHLASRRATHVVTATRDGTPWDGADALAQRLRELGIISSRPFVPRGRVQAR